MVRHTTEDIFAKWAELNNVTGVTAVKAFIEDNGREIIDPEFPGVVGYEMGDYFIFTLTLSYEFAAYADGENGGLLKEALEKTFTGYGNIDYDEFHLVISEP